MLEGCKILVVEDEPMIAFDIEDTLIRAGADVRIAQNVLDAFKLLQNESLSVAVVDHVLRGETSDLIYIELRRRGIRFIVTSGMKAPVNDALVLPKPFSMRRLVRVLAAMKNEQVQQKST